MKQISTIALNIIIKGIPVWVIGLAYVLVKFCLKP